MLCIHEQKSVYTDDLNCVFLVILLYQVANLTAEEVEARYGFTGSTETSTIVPRD